MYYPEDAPWLDVVADWETYYAPRDGYTLTKMDNPSYILDPRFEEIGCAFKLDRAATQWIDGPHVGQYLGDLGAAARAARRPIRFISHSILFDACIASWHHGFVADQYVDTLGLSRALLGYLLRNHRLATVARFLGLGEKGTTVLKVQNMRRADIIATGLYGEYAAYSCQDAELCRGIFDRLFHVEPWEEIEIADIVHRAAIIPELHIDRQVLAVHAQEVAREKDEQLAAAGLDISTPAARAMSVGMLMSNDQMAAALTRLGVDPPTKISPATEEETWAFAKDDPEFTDLLEHDDPAVQTLVAARLGIKSTLEETRTRRLANIATLAFPSFRTIGLLPAAYRVSGAHTHRLSGDWQLNLQNLPRPSLRRPQARLRCSIVAPAGKKLVASDSRQIEARMAATFCEQWDLVGQFERGEDVYCNRATKVFGYPVDKTMVPQRFCGKILALSANYQIGWEHHQHSVAHLSREQLGPDKVIILSDEDARLQINSYRSDVDKISGMWRHIQFVVLPAMLRPDTDFMLNCVRVMHEKLVLPNGMVMHYAGLHQDAKTGDWRYSFGGRWKKVYGGKVLENICQALARIVVMTAARSLRDPMAAIGAKLVLQGHDELAYLVEDRFVAYAVELLDWAMKLRPEWLPRLPVDCETKVGQNYGAMEEVKLNRGVSNTRITDAPTSHHDLPRAAQAAHSL